MKRSAWDKLLLVCLALLILLTGVMFFCMALRLIDAQRVSDILLYANGGFLHSVMFAFAGVLLAALPLRVLYAFLIKRDAANECPSLLIRKGENGSLQISAAAVDTIIQQYCKKRPAITSCQSDVSSRAEGASIHLKLSFDPKADIAEEISAIQEGLSAHLEKACGIHVAGVDITIIPAGE